MKKLAVLVALALAALAQAAQADPIPAYVLEKDYQNCMGGETAQQDANRSQYCNCVRDGMKNWDLSAYINLAKQEEKTGSQQLPPQIETLAKSCIAKVLH